MNNATIVTIICVCMTGGIIFAALAVMLFRSKGNTMRDILNSESYKNNINALSMEVESFNKKYKLSTQLPAVALFFIAFLCTLALPAFNIYLVYKQNKSLIGGCPDETITISSSIGNDEKDGIFMVRDDFTVQRSGAFKMKLNKLRLEESYTLHSIQYDPVTINLRYDSLKSSIYVSFVNSDVRDTLPFNPEVRFYDLEPFELPPAATPLPVCESAPPEPVDVHNIRSERERSGQATMSSDFLGG
ncbi:MAG: hypothetical protein GF398_02690 [Chitinivibrionales bacterium]|nr:hypothetical protein [Chitinivibrionales bacterium]